MAKRPTRPVDDAEITEGLDDGGYASEDADHLSYEDAAAGSSAASFEADDGAITDDLESENDRLRAELAAMRSRNADVEKNLNRADLLIVPKAWKIRSHAMGRHPRGTILREDQFPPGVLDRMRRRRAVTPVFDLPANYTFPASDPPPETPETREARQARILGQGISQAMLPLFEHIGK